MGEDVGHHEFSRADRTRYREKIRRCLDVFARMLRDERFEADDPMTGLEVELNLVDDRGEPAMRNVEALEAIANPAFVTELGQSWIQNIMLEFFDESMWENSVALQQQQSSWAMNDHMITLGASKKHHWLERA